MICSRPKHWQVTEWRVGSSSSHFCSVILPMKPCFLKCRFPYISVHFDPYVYFLVFFFAVPKMQFKERVYTGNENDGQIVATIHRSGDVQYRSSVRCYTRQGSAQVMMDFEERPNTDISTITFLPGKFRLEISIWNLRKPSFGCEISIKEIQFLNSTSLRHGLMCTK